MTTPPEEWVPLVSAMDNGFVLSPEFRRAIGPLWGRSWKTLAFVAHIVSFFDDWLEHLLDFTPKGDDGGFDVHPEVCKEIARAYSKEFLDLPAEWYHDLFRAKLLSIRVPVEIISQAKLAYFVRFHDHTTLAMGFVNLLKLRARILDETMVARIGALASLPPAQIWLRLEEEAQNSLSNGLLTLDDLSELMASPNEWADVGAAEQEST